MRFDIVRDDVFGYYSISGTVNQVYIEPGCLADGPSSNRCVGDRVQGTSTASTPDHGSSSSIVLSPTLLAIGLRPALEMSKEEEKTTCLE
jgi:hypothetical protein